MPLTKIEGPSLGNVTISSITSNASFDSGTLFVDAANNVVGIGNTTPIHKLRVEGTTSVSGNVSIDANLVVTGNLTVSGTTVTVNSENVLIKDNLITLSSNVTGAPVLDAGIEVNRGTSANVILKWNETSDIWQLTNDGTNYGNILTTLSSTGVNADALSTGTVPLARLTSANTSANGVVDTTTQTFAGNKTFQNTASFSNTVSITGAANALSTLGVTGIFTASANSSHVGAATFSNTVSITGAANALSTLGVTGTLSALGQLSVTGNATFDTSTLFVDATNDRVGFGTTSPAYPFDVTKAGGGNFVGYFKNTSNGTPYTLRVQEPASPVSGYPLFDVVNNAGTTAYFLVHSGTGNIGIGTSSPSSILHLRGSAPTLTLDDSGSTTTAISFRPAAASYAERGRLALDVANGEMRLAAGVSGTTYFQTFYTNGTERMRITSDGNVGIGVTPSYRLDITSSAGFAVARFNQANAGKTGVLFAENGTQRAFLSQVGLYSGTTDGNFGVFVETGYNFQIATNGSVTSKFTVHTGGNIAIGATAKLYLDGVAGTGDTYITETSANIMRMYVGGADTLVIDYNAGSTYVYARSTDFRIDTGKKFYLDGGSDTYFNEIVANNIRVVAGGNNIASFGVSGGSGAEFFGSLIVNAAQKFYLDGGVDSYLSEAGANIIRVTVGGVSAVQWDTTGMYLNTAPPTSASAANAVVGSGSDYLRRSTSSIRYKHDIATLDATDAVSAVMAMRPVTYRGKTDEDQRRFVGFVAEEMQEIAPLLCTYDEGGESGTPNYVTYDRVTAYLVAVVQQQQQKIAALEARLATLEG